MKILHVMAAKSNGGAETYSTDVMLALHHAGIEQCVVLHDEAPRLKELESAGLRIAKGVLHSPLHAWRRFRVSRLIAEEKPDVVHCWMRRAASLLPKSPIDASAVVGWFGDYEDVRNFGRCTDLVGVTPDIVKSMRDNGISDEHATYIPTFPSIVDAPPLDRAALETPAEAIVLLTLSRLHPVKGLDTLLQALTRLPNAYVWMTGDGPSRTVLEQLARRLGVLSRVRFLGWRTDRGALLKAADICVLPSRYEPFGTVILEAWSMKTPLVACAAAGPRDHIRHGLDGMIAPIDDAPALAGMIAAVADHPDVGARLIAGGYRRYVESFTPAAVTEHWLGYYRGLLRSRKRRAA